MLYAIKFVLFAGLTLILSLGTVLLGVWDRNGKLAYQVNRVWTWLVLHLGGVSIKVDGLDNIKPDQAYIFMVNHQSNIDIPVLIEALRAFQLRWIAKRELLWVPGVGWALWATRHVIVDRGDRKDAMTSLKRAQQLLNAGISVVVFPEGTRSPDGNLLPFKKGGFLLAVKTRTPVVAVTINGSRRVLPKGGLRVRPGTVEISISAPIATANHQPGAVRALTRQVEQIITNKLHPAGQTLEANETTLRLSACSSGLE
jgi:1-acyl-sn-glycerol-3-phosphate acyltransferase